MSKKSDINENIQSDVGSTKSGKKGWLAEKIILRPIRSMFCCAGIVCVLMVAFFFISQNLGEKYAKTTSVESEIKSISKLETLEYDYTMTSNMLIENRILFYSYDSQSVYTYSGTIKFGIDCDNVEIEEDNHVITVYLPEVEILSSEIDPDSYNYILDSKTTGTDFAENQAEDKKDAESMALAQGCYERALENAEDQLKRLILYLKNDTAEEIYTVQFVESDS